MIREEITSLLGKQVGNPYSQAQLDEIYAEGKERYEKLVPPGYKDAKEGTRYFQGLAIENRYGDLILWKQIIDKAKEVDRPVVFITDDAKDDWWWEFKGRTIGPRPELVAEIRKEANVGFYMYQSNRFIEYARTHLPVDVKPEVLEEIRDIAEEGQGEAPDQISDASPIYDIDAMISAGWRVETDNKQGGKYKYWHWRKGSGKNRQYLAGGNLENAPAEILKILNARSGDVSE